MSPVPGPSGPDPDGPGTDGPGTEAPAGDTAGAYASWPDKGPAHEGYRLTLLTARTQVAPGEQLHVVHVVESLDADAPLHVVGPKAVRGELVDGTPTTAAVAEDEHPLRPQPYNGRVRPGPGVDTAWEVTTYAFETPGRHTVQWAPGAFRSNVLVVEVR